MVTIDPVRSDADAAAAERLAWAFVAWRRDRYRERSALIDDYLERQRFAEDVTDLRRAYAPPRGECLLARLDGAPVGLLMFKSLGGGLCEMNRMYVDPAARGRGVGGALVDRLFAAARAMGQTRMQLGALDRHHEALALYARMGFRADPSRPPQAGVLHLARDL